MKFTKKIFVLIVLLFGLICFGYIINDNDVFDVKSDNELCDFIVNDSLSRIYLLQIGKFKSYNIKNKKQLYCYDISKNIQYLSHSNRNRMLLWNSDNELFELSINTGIKRNIAIKGIKPYDIIFADYIQKRIYIIYEKDDSFYLAKLSNRKKLENIYKFDDSISQLKKTYLIENKYLVISLLTEEGKSRIYCFNIPSKKLVHKFTLKGTYILKTNHVLRKNKLYFIQNDSSKDFNKLVCLDRNKFSTYFKIPNEIEDIDLLSNCSDSIFLVSYNISKNGDSANEYLFNLKNKNLEMISENFNYPILFIYRNYNVFLKKDGMVYYNTLGSKKEKVFFSPWKGKWFFVDKFLSEKRKEDYRFTKKFYDYIVKNNRVALEYDEDVDNGGSYHIFIINMDNFFDK